MGADRARISFDASRQYREVISQQGRVTLEADVNEAQRIGTEEVRVHALDFVGPWGTPDDGYRIHPLAGGDLEAGPGTMYVAGLRVETGREILYSEQAEWLDKGMDPLWRSPKEALTSDAMAWLHCIEHEVDAVEDPELREVALGGPDSGARTRLLQRVVLSPCKADSCEAGLKTLIAFLGTRGVSLDDESGELKSRSRLLVTQVATDPVSEPCDPPAQSGYLVADNQLIRVQIVEYDPAKQEGVLIWGLNNASIMYRCKALDSVTLQLETTPVSPEHAPRANQAVQVLLPTAKIGEDAFVSALRGHDAVMAAPYNNETGTITLPAPLDAAYTAAGDGQPLFLRLWEKRVPFRLNLPVELTDTGLAVTISSAGGGRLSVGDYWCFAGRPLTPNAVYPQRIMAEPQPPEGPRQWACPLAVLEPSGRRLALIDDCRRHFDNLAELTAREWESCCCITLGPRQVDQLQRIINRLAKDKGRMEAVVRLEPGRYVLKEPLRINRRHRGLVLESCTGGGVTFSADKKAVKRFSQGMFLLDGAMEVTLRGLTWLIQECPWPELEAPLNKKKQLMQRRLKLTIKKTAIGLHVNACSGLALEDCNFVFNTDQNTLGAGILGRGALDEIQLRRCEWQQAQIKTVSHIAGVLIGPVLDTATGEQMTVPQLDSLSISDCTFNMLSAGVFLISQIEAAAVRDSVAQGCHIALAVIEMPEAVGEATATTTTRAAAAEASQMDKFQKAMVNDQLAAVLNQMSQLLIPDAPAIIINRREMDASLDGIRSRRRARLLARNRDLARIMMEVEGRQAALAVMRLNISGNEFDCRLALPDKSESGPAVFIWDMLNQGVSTANITGNTFWNHSSYAPTLFVRMIKSFNITGNNLVNSVQDVRTGPNGVPGNARMALLVAPGGRLTPQHMKQPVNLFTVTGNTMLGSSNLDNWVRNEWKGKLPDELQALLTWNFFNTET